MSGGSSHQRCRFTPRAAARCHLHGPMVASAEERWQQREASVNHVHDAPHVANCTACKTGAALLGHEDEGTVVLCDFRRKMRWQMSHSKDGTRSQQIRSTWGAPSAQGGRLGAAGPMLAGNSGQEESLAEVQPLCRLCWPGMAKHGCHAWLAWPQGPTGWKPLGKGLRRHTSVWFLCARRWGSEDSAVIPPTAASSCHKDARRAGARGAAGSTAARAVPGARSEAGPRQTRPATERANAGRERGHAVGLAATSA